MSNKWERTDVMSERLVAPDGRILAEVSDSYTRSETSVTIVGRLGFGGTYNTRDNAKRAAEKAVSGISGEGGRGMTPSFSIGSAPPDDGESRPVYTTSHAGEK